MGEGDGGDGGAHSPGEVGDGGHHSPCEVGRQGGGGRRAGERIESGCESGCGSFEQLKLPIGFMWFGILNMYHLE